MKLLLDENLPHELRHCLPGHEVFTSTYMGWSGIENGELLAKAAAAGFDAMLSKDQGIEHQQNLTILPLSVVMLVAPSNKIDDIRPLLPELLRVLRDIEPKRFVQVGPMI